MFQGPRTKPEIKTYILESFKTTLPKPVRDRVLEGLVDTDSGKAILDSIILLMWEKNAEIDGLISNKEKTRGN